MHRRYVIMAGRPAQTRLNGKLGLLRGLISKINEELMISMSGGELG